MIVPTLCVGTPPRTLRVRFCRDAERPGLHSHAERGNDQNKTRLVRVFVWPRKKPLTLALPKRRTARRERGLIGGCSGNTPT
ncbi:hypothetical protein CQ009_03525 [Pseudomonas sp. MYb2]|nr:hypothetical protein CQ025_10430 [Pseudomonas sp. MYb3]PRC36641.1 hypothetical protein CQ009_03525 [Pseudomonas sp. MYb2]